MGHEVSDYSATGEGSPEPWNNIGTIVLMKIMIQLNYCSLSLQSHISMFLYIMNFL